MMTRVKLNNGWSLQCVRLFIEHVLGFLKSPEARAHLWETRVAHFHADHACSALSGAVLASLLVCPTGTSQSSGRTGKKRSLPQRG